MKQRIEIPQLQELTEEQKQRLRDWWKPRTGDQYTYQEMNIYVVLGDYYGGTEIIHYVAGNDGYSEPFRNMHRKERSLPVLSIGQMIELLQGSIIDIKRYVLDEDERVRKDNQWFINGDDTSGFEYELCDALWKAVKSVL